MKRLIALLLALMLVFSVSLALTACDDGDSEETPKCEKHVDEDGNNKCDNCDKDMPKDPEPGPGPGPAPEPGPGSSTDGKILANAIIAQINAAASVKLDIELSLTAQMQSWYYGDNDEEEFAEDYTEGVATITIVVSKSDTGVNAKVDVLSKSRGEDGSPELETVMSFTALYIVDGDIYIYDEYYDAYVKQIIPEMDPEELEEMTAMLEQIMAGVTLPSDEELEELKAVLGNLVISAFSVKDNKGSILIDAKPVVDDILSYIVGLDLDTKTVEDVLNDLLALVDDQITVADIIATLKDVAGLTVNEAIAEIDAMLTEEAGTTLQGLYDSIVTDPDMVQLTKDMLKAQGMDDATIDETIAMIQSMNIADMIEEYGIGDVALIQLLIGSVENEIGPEEEDDALPLSEEDMPSPDEDMPSADELIDSFFGEIEMFLALTLSDIENIAVGGEDSPIAMMQTILGDFVINELNNKVEINFVQGYNISDITEEMNVDFVLTVPSGFESKNNVLDLDVQFRIKLHSISGSEIDIALPDDATVLIGTPNSDPDAAKTNLEANGYTVSLLDISETSEVDGATVSLSIVGGEERIQVIYFFETEEIAEEAFYTVFEEALYEYAKYLDLNYEYIGYAGNTIYIASPETLYATNTVFLK